MERRHCGPPSCPPRGRGKYLLPSDKLQRLARDQSSHTRLFLILMKKICTRQEDEQRSFAVRGSSEKMGGRCTVLYCGLWEVWAGPACVSVVSIVPISIVPGRRETLQCLN